MELLLFIATIFVQLVGFLLLRHYLPTYFSKKAENLATKQDIGEITKEVEIVRQIFQKNYDISKAETDFYNEMNRIIWELLATLKKYEFEKSKKINRNDVFADPEVKSKYFIFIDAANEILGKAYIFLPEANYVRLKTALEEGNSLNDKAKNLLYAMRKSIHPETKLNASTDIKELNY